MTSSNEKYCFELEAELTHHFLWYKLDLLMTQQPSTLQASGPAKIHNTNFFLRCSTKQTRVLTAFFIINASR